MTRKSQLLQRIAPQVDRDYHADVWLRLRDHASPSVALQQTAARFARHDRRRRENRWGRRHRLVGDFSLLDNVEQAMSLIFV